MSRGGGARTSVASRCVGRSCAPLPRTGGTSLAATLDMDRPGRRRRRRHGGLGPPRRRGSGAGGRPCPLPGRDRRRGGRGPRRQGPALVPRLDDRRRPGRRRSAPRSRRRRTPARASPPRSRRPAPRSATGCSSRPPAPTSCGCGPSASRTATASTPAVTARPRSRTSPAAVGSWTWVKRAIAIPSAGEHIVQLWMREDGLHVDRLLVAQSASFTPDRRGPGGHAAPEHRPGHRPRRRLTGRQPAAGATGVAVGANVVGHLLGGDEPGHRERLDHVQRWRRPPAGRP